ncbi:MAG: efflux RND transporter periplasmic adaptor subunit [Candidatus Rokubacteria bacterium]|nr:efflux RND transporter periplasmic adaptor subunit [Candidatus Rokubacteria bacterium]
MTRLGAPLLCCGLLLAALTGAGRSGAQPPVRPQGAPGAAKPLPVTVARAEARPVQRSVETVGSLLPWQDVVVKTEQPGTVARLFADLGDAVGRGKVLAEYDAREFQFAVEQAEADLLSARQSFARARTTVGASEAALRRVKDNLSALEAEVARNQSQLEWAKSELARSQELFAKQLIAARDVDNARNQHNVAAAQLALAVNARSQHPDQVRIAEAQLEADHAGLRVAEAEVARREASLGIAKKRLGDTTIRAPIAGVIAKRHLNAGEYVKENTAVFTVVALDPLKYTGTVSERFAPDLRVGQRIALSVEAYPGKTFPGQVTRLSPAVEVQTRSLALEGRVANADGRLRPGFFAKGVVLTRTDAAVAFVPAEAVVYFVGISKVFVVVGSKVEERLVKTGARQGALVEIVEGVRVGDTVATTNLAQLFNGAPVTLVDDRIRR